MKRLVLSAVQGEPVAVYITLLARSHVQERWEADGFPRDWVLALTERRFRNFVPSLAHNYPDGALGTLGNSLWGLGYDPCRKG